MQERVRNRCHPTAWHEIDAGTSAKRLFGDTLPMHTLMQKGLVPLSRTAIDGAIAKNGAAVALNRRAFDWGRILATGFNPESIEGSSTPLAKPRTLDEVIAHRMQELTAYQNAAYAERYRELIFRARSAEVVARPGSESFAMAVAVNAYRLMAYKDEYEIARLYSDEEFKTFLAAQFSSSSKVSL